MAGVSPQRAPVSSREARLSRIGPFRLSIGKRLLTRDGVPVPLGARAFDILIHLVENPDRVVSKQSLMNAVWPGLSVEQNNLTVNISALRRVLGAGPDGRSLIQTVTGRGYMLLLGQQALEAAEPATGSEPVATGPLPRRGDRFVGRVHERDAIIALLDAHPLVTVTAIGGMGKTRLVQEMAHHVAARYPDGVAFTELATVDRPAQATEHVATLFPLGNAEGPAIDRITAFLRHRRLLLVLDNCEHVVDPMAELAHRIIETCPGVTILATSREGLGVIGEHIYRLPPLAVPPSGEIEPEEALRYDAVRLFVERAKAAVPEFRFDAGAVPGVVDICTRLDGIALAIEMAAPRLRALTPAQIATRLHESLRLLTAPDRNAVARHRTLRAVIDWSYSLLDDGGRRLMACLAVFATPVDLEAVLAVAAGGGGETEMDVLQELTGLIDRSLVLAETGDGPARYRLLETVRQYARDRLVEERGAGPFTETALRRRHAEHYAAVFEAAYDAWPTAPTREWFATAGSDAGELRTAIAWCFRQGGTEADLELGLRLVGASTPLWWELPNLPLREARRWFELAAARIGPQTPARVAARVWFGLSWRDMRHNDVENLPAAERAVALFRETSDTAGLAAALWRAGSARLTRNGGAETARDLQEAEHLLRQMAPTKWLAVCLIRQGDRLARAGQNAAGLAAYAEGLAISERTGFWYGLTNGASNMSDLMLMDGDAKAALVKLRALRQALPLGPRTPLTGKLAAHLVIARLDDEALDAVAEVVDMAPAIGYGGALARSMEAVALLRARAGDIATAVRLAGYARRVMPPGFRWGAPRAVFEQLEAELAGRVPVDELQAMLAQGGAWDEATAAAAARAAVASHAAALGVGVG